MHVTYRNVNDAFRGLTELFANYGEAHTHVCEMSRRPYSNPNGSGVCTTIDEPVTITYSHPCERVLFNAERDANPFLHLYEALWMLAGRNDVAPLAYYAKQMAQYSDDGKTLNGAYGYRWRRAKGPGEPTLVKVTDPLVYSGQRVVDGFVTTGYTDQLDILVQHLKANPSSRRAVLAMWNVEDDLLKLDSGRDLCCNLNVMFSIREVMEQTIHNDWLGEGHSMRIGDVVQTKYLDMTVTNRSNDMVWGMLGSNYVTFSVLQEYMAARLGVHVGRYHHFTNNLHVYDWNFKPEEFLAAERNEGSNEYTLEPYTSMEQLNAAPIIPHSSAFKFVPLVRDPEVFEKELSEFVEAFGSEKFRTEAIGYGAYGREVAMNLDRFTEPFLRTVAGPMLLAHRAHKVGERAYASVSAANIKAHDWRIACTEWLKRRVK